MLNHQFIGTDSQYLIVFLHEGLGCIEMWKEYPKVVHQLTQQQVLVYDRAGYGKSEGDLTQRKPNYLHLAAEELHHLISELHLQNKPLILYGHSDGGSIALLYAAKHPQNVTAVVTEAAHVFVEEETLAGIKPAEVAFKNGKLNGLKKYHGNRFEEVFWAWVNIWNHPDFKNWNIEDDIKAIQCPQLIIQGQDDQYGTLLQVEKIKQATLGPTALLTPTQCAHAPHKEQTDLVLSHLQSFLTPLIRS